MAARRAAREARRQTIHKSGWSEVRYEDLGLQSILEQMLELKGMKARAGYVPPASNAKYPDGKKVAKVAAIQEYGSGHQPSRGYMRMTIFRSRHAIQALETAEIEKVIAGAQAPVQALANVGAYILGLFRAQLASAASWAAPLDPDTIRQKGSATPLHETETLSKALSWTVKQGSKLLARGS